MPYNGAGDLHFANRLLGGKPIGLPTQLTYPLTKLLLSNMIWLDSRSWYEALSIFIQQRYTFFHNIITL